MFHVTHLPRRFHLNFKFINISKLDGLILLAKKLLLLKSLRIRSTINFIKCNWLSI